jgi:hypothetical protein
VKKLARVSVKIKAASSIYIKSTPRGENPLGEKSFRGMVFRGMVVRGKKTSGKCC